MNDYLIDTNHWSHLQRRHPGVLARLRALPGDVTLFMPVIAQAELLAGVEIVAQGMRRDELRVLYEQTVLQAAEVLPIDSRVAERFAAIFAQLRRDGRPIETNDIWVGAIALVHDLTVVSADAHLRFIHDLRVEDWTSSQPAQ